MRSRDASIQPDWVVVLNRPRGRTLCSDNPGIVGDPWPVPWVYSRWIGTSPLMHLLLKDSAMRTRRQPRFCWQCPSYTEFQLCFEQQSPQSWPPLKGGAGPGTGPGYAAGVGSAPWVRSSRYDPKSIDHSYCWREEAAAKAAVSTGWRGRDATQRASTTSCCWCEEAVAEVAVSTGWWGRDAPRRASTTLAADLKRLLLRQRCLPIGEVRMSLEGIDYLLLPEDCCSSAPWNGSGTYRCKRKTNFCRERKLVLDCGEFVESKRGRCSRCTVDWVLKGKADCVHVQRWSTCLLLLLGLGSRTNKGGRNTRGLMDRWDSSESSGAESQWGASESLDVAH